MPETPPRRPPTALLVVAIVSGLVAIVAGIFAFGGDDDTTVASSGAPDGTGTTIDLEPVIEGEQAPDVSFPMWTGETRTFADFAGTPLVVNFFSSWCAPCIQEMPDLEKAHQDFGDRITFLGINLQDRRSDAQEVVDETGVTYPLAEDFDGTVFNAFGANGMPTTVFISADGEILDVRTGRMPESEIYQRMERLLAS